MQVDVGELQLLDHEVQLEDIGLAMQYPIPDQLQIFSEALLAHLSTFLLT